MIHPSAELKQLMTTNTSFLQYAEITLIDGTTLELTPAEFTVSNNIITDGAGTTSFPIGVAVQRIAQLELLNNHEQYSNMDFYGAKVRLYLKYKLSDTVEEINKGYYTVTTPETVGETVTITAYDDMYRTDKAYETNLMFPATATSLLVDACTTCGISVAYTAFRNSTFQIMAEPSSNLTFRQVIGYIAMIAGGNARINDAGRLEIISYADTWGNAVDTISGWSNLTVDTDEIEITGVKLTYQGESSTETLIVGEEGYCITVENPLIDYDRETGISLIATPVVGMTFRRFSGDIPANPLLEFMDTVNITDRRGKTYKTFLTDAQFVVCGFTTIKNNSASPIKNNTTYTTSVTKTEILARQLVEKERTSREQAIIALNTALKDSSGLYETAVEQEDGSTIYYLHDKPTLAESQVVMKLTANAIGVSTDGGASYPYGFQVTGEMVVKILEADGINASWINTGALTVKDGNGNTVLLVDVDNGRVAIAADAIVTTAGMSVEESLAEVETTVAKNRIVMLTSESHTFSGGVDGAPVGSTCTTGVLAYNGTTPCKITVGTISCPVGILAAVDDNGTTAPVITFMTTAVLSDACECIIPVTVDGVVINKQFGISVAKTGAGGDNGAGLSQLTRYYKRAANNSGLWDGGTTGLLEVKYRNTTLYKVSATPVQFPSSGNLIFATSTGETMTVAYAADNGDYNIEAGSESFTCEIAPDGLCFAMSTNYYHEDKGIEPGLYLLAFNGSYVAGIEGVDLGLTVSVPTTCPPAGTDTVTFDMTLAGHEHFMIEDLSEDGVTQLLHLVKISDTVVPASALADGITVTVTTSITTDGETETSANAVQIPADGIEEDDSIGICIATDSESDMSAFFVSQTCEEDGLTLTPGIWVYCLTATGTQDDGAVLDGVIGISAITIPDYDGFEIWSTAEPQYKAGATDTAYYTDLTLLTDGSWWYTTPQVLASYEAQKANYEATVVSVDVEYYLSTSNTELAGGEWVTTAPAWKSGYYVWSRTVMTTGGGAVSYSPSSGGVCISGTDGTDGKGVTSIVEQYYRSSSPTTLTGGSWVSTYPGWAAGTYIWTRSVITYTDKTSITTEAVCVSGYDGTDGTPGRSVVSITTQYYLSTSKETATGGSWSDTAPTYIDKGKYLWTRLKIVYSNPTATEYTTGQYECLAESRIEQLKDSITLEVVGADGTTSKIKMDDEGTIELTGDVIAQRLNVDELDVDTLLARDISATGKIQFNNGRYSLLIDEDSKIIQLKSWGTLRLEGSDLNLISSGGKISLSAINGVWLETPVHIDGTKLDDYIDNIITGCWEAKY